jgi:hypothetical protein
MYAADPPRVNPGGDNVLAAPLVFVTVRVELGTETTIIADILVMVLVFVHPNLATCTPLRSKSKAESIADATE